MKIKHLSNWPQQRIHWKFTNENTFGRRHTKFFSLICVLNYGNDHDRHRRRHRTRFRNRTLSLLRLECSVAKRWFRMRNCRNLNIFLVVVPQCKCERRWNREKNALLMCFYFAVFICYLGSRQTFWLARMNDHWQQASNKCTGEAKEKKVIRNNSRKKKKLLIIVYNEVTNYKFADRHGNKYVFVLIFFHFLMSNAASK